MSKLQVLYKADKQEKAVSNAGRRMSKLVDYLGENKKIELKDTIDHLPVINECHETDKLGLLELDALTDGADFSYTSPK